MPSVHPVLDGSGTELALRCWWRTATPADSWLPHLALLGAGGRLSLVHRSFLLMIDDRRVLVDAGVGPKEVRRPRGGRHRGGSLLAGLAALSLQPDDITDVVFTHAHFDHVGWASRDGRPTFPVATYWMHTAEWNHAVEAPGASDEIVKLLSPVRGQVELFDRPTTLAPGLTARPAPGHTPGSTIYVLTGGPRPVYFVGDLAHCWVELVDADWRCLFDHDSTAAIRSRRDVVDELVANGGLLAAPHFDGTGMGSVVRAGTGRLQWVPVTCPD